MGEKLLAHVHQGRGAAGREVEPPDQFLAARLGRLVQGIDGDRAGIAAIGVNRRLELGPVGTEAIRERRQERQARGQRRRRIGIEKGARQRHARGLAAARQQQFAEGDEIALGDRLARAADQGAPAIAEGLHQLVEE